MQDRILRAKELLATIRHAAMATDNADGSPHNTPYFFMYDDALQHLYWGSHSGSQHSKNVAHTGQIFVALYDGNQLGGLYIQAKNARITEGEEFIAALTAHNAARARVGKDPLPREYYDNSKQKMYAADIVAMWVNAAERNDEGLVVRDFRMPITAQDLLR
jgi:hypothetical protein